MSQARSSDQQDGVFAKFEQLVRAFGENFDMIEAFRNGESVSSLCERYRITPEILAKRAMFIASEIDTIAQLNVNTGRHDRIQLLAHQGCGLSLEEAVKRLRADRSRRRQQQADTRRPVSDRPSSANHSHPKRAQSGHSRSESAPAVRQSSQMPSPSSSSTRSTSPAPPPRPAFDRDLAKQNYRTPTPLTPGQTESLIFLALTQRLPLATIKARLNLLDREDDEIQEHLHREVERRRREGMPVFDAGEAWDEPLEGYYQIGFERERTHGHVLGEDGTCVCWNCEDASYERPGVGEQWRDGKKAVMGWDLRQAARAAKALAYDGWVEGPNAWPRMR